MFLQTFFPPLPEHEAPENLDVHVYHQLPIHGVTEKEVQEAIFRASPFKAAEIDEIPAVVWQKILPVIKGALIALFQASLNQGRLPDKWKIAKIIPMRKPQKGNYTEPEFFRPISLLPTISKALESVIAQKLSFFVEEYGLLPDNHFGGRKKSCTIGYRKS